MVGKMGRSRVEMRAMFPMVEIPIAEESGMAIVAPNESTLQPRPLGSESDKRLTGIVAMVVVIEPSVLMIGVMPGGLVGILFLLLPKVQERQVLERPNEAAVLRRSLEWMIVAVPSALD